MPPFPRWQKARTQLSLAQMICSESRNISSVIQENYLILNHVRLDELTKQDTFSN
jgi:hypothetical protein